MRHVLNYRGVIAVLVLGLSVCVNVLQANKIRSLAANTGVRGTLAGTTAGTVVGASADGQVTTLRLNRGLPTVLYYFSSSCRWCERNWQNVAELSRRAGGRYRVVAVTAEAEMGSFLKDRAPGLEVLEQLSPETVQAFGFRGTPHTVVVGPDGIITHEWRGAYTDRIARQISELFGVVLPGLVGQ